MKVLMCTLLAFTLASCSTPLRKISSEASFNEVFDIGEGDPVPKELQTNITDEQVAEILKKIEDLRKTAIQDVKPADAGNPDYELAKANLNKEITRRLTDFIQTLAVIDLEVKDAFSKLYAAQIKVDQNPSEPLYRELLASEMKRIIPNLNASINIKYQRTLRALYLQDRYPVNLGKRNIFNEKRSMNGMVAFGDCVTSGCMLMLTDDITKWLLTVASLNQEIDFLNFNSKTTVTIGTTPTSSNISLAIYDAADRMLKGPKSNVQYNVANYLWQFLKVPGGAATALISAPAYMVEKVARFSVKLATLKIMKLDLKLSLVEAQSINEIKMDMKTNIRNMISSQQIPAYIYGADLDKFAKEGKPIQQKAQYLQNLKTFEGVWQSGSCKTTLKIEDEDLTAVFDNCQNFTSSVAHSVYVENSNYINVEGVQFYQSYESNYSYNTKTYYLRANNLVLYKK